MTYATPLRLVSSTVHPRPEQPDEVDGDEVLEWTIPAGVAGSPPETLVNPTPATPATRPARGLLGRLFGWRH
jgi:hypothetical protein